VIGVVLVLGMVLAGVAVVVGVGATALSDLRSQSAIERGQTTMTQLDTRASMVALGDTPSQTVTFGSDSGRLSVEDRGWLRVTHANYTGNGHDETVFNATLGTVSYGTGETELAYQGGGIWRTRAGAGAGSTMVSPPEFHYRGATLTLPVVRVTGGSVDGSALQVTPAGPTRRVFPNATGPTAGTEVGAPYNQTDAAYANPVANGTVNVTVGSEYHQAWAEYFRSRTEGQITDLPGERVRVSLESLAGSVGAFAMPQEGNGISVGGFGTGHPIDDFEITLAADNAGSNFQTMHWAFYADEGSQQFELHFFSDGKCSGGPGGGSYSGDLDVSVYYYESGGTSAHEEWQNTSVNVGSNDDFTVDCSSTELTIDLLSDTPLEYGDLQITGSDNKWYYGPEIDSRSVPASTSTFDRHGPDTGQYTSGGTEELGVLVNHYLELLGPQFELEVTDGPGGSSRIDEGASSGRLEFETGGDGRFITFLHITENRINVTGT
jgi:hypothetical protein